jgi:AraC family transcriptional regulator, regulatory protein of adaptative response / methylphosphotriester-DNA alkyltransferase methyltransferase
MKRPEEITADFLGELDKHIIEIVSEKTDFFFGINDFARILCIHPTHLSNTIKQTTGKAPCDHCEEKLIVVAKQLLLNNELNITKIAARLTYDPPSFTKFFKKHTGMTPSFFRSSETKTIQSLPT